MLTLPIGMIYAETKIRPIYLFANFIIRMSILRTRKTCQGLITETVGPTVPSLQSFKNEIAYKNVKMPLLGIGKATKQT